VEKSGVHTRKRCSCINGPGVITIKDIMVSSPKNEFDAKLKVTGLS
jgi:hypothetical protein